MRSFIRGVRRWASRSLSSIADTLQRLGSEASPSDTVKNSYKTSLPVESTTPMIIPLPAGGSSQYTARLIASMLLARDGLSVRYTIRSVNNVDLMVIWLSG